MTNKKVLVIGGNGQLGSSLKGIIPEATFVDRDEFDITDKSAYDNWDWDSYEVIINAAAFTDVDGAETEEGKAIAKLVNAKAVELLAEVATKHQIILAHVSSDYVFDGTKDLHSEDEPFNPLSVYGQTKADGDRAAVSTPKHYLIRTSWVIGQGKNFVATMMSLAEKDVAPKVVDDQLGRLTLADDLAEVIVYLIKNNSPFGTYNFSNDGEVSSWADIAKKIYQHMGKDPDMVTRITTEQYASDKPHSAKRPLKSALDLTKIKEAGFRPANWGERLSSYIEVSKRND